MLKMVVLKHNNVFHSLVTFFFPGTVSPDDEFYVSFYTIKSVLHVKLRM